jgi:transposase
LLLDDETIRRYIRIYQEKGLSELLRDKYQGCLCKLTENQTQELTKYLEQKVYQNSADIVEYIKQKYGITYSTKGLIKFLHRIGFVYKKPKHIPGKANEEAQKKFVDETYKELKENLAKNDRIYFMDGTHPHHNSMPAYGWIKKGQVKGIPANTGRERLNINGVIDSTNFDFIYRADQTINAQSTIELFKQIEVKNPLANKIFIIADNAKYYRSKLVAEYLKNSKIKIKFLPPYSPNLNLIERLWKFFHKIILYNKYYDSFDKFKQASFNFFDNIKNYKSSLETLLTDNFQIISKSNFSQI